jgi:hypothetical protein
MTYRNADTRIREAFDALRAEIEDIFGKPYSDEIAESLEWLEAHEQHFHDFAKLPADA